MARGVRTRPARHPQPLLRAVARCDSKALEALSDRPDKQCPEFMAGRTNRKEAPRQLELAPMMKRPRRRRGPGRPRGRTKVAHARRPEFVARHPLHVTLRCAQGDVSLRRYHPLEVVRGAIRAGGHREDFRVVEFHLLSNHLHLIVEAAGAGALARGMQGLAVRLARGINRALGRSGKLFVERYHARCLRSPRSAAWWCALSST